MLATILQRFLQGLVVLFVLHLMTFFLVNAMPGDPFRTSDRAMPEHIRARVAAYYGYDKPLLVQYGLGVKNLLAGDLGPTSRLEGREVSEIIGQAFPVSLQLGIVAMTIAVVMGIPLGVIAAWKKNTIMDYSAMALAMTGICIPGFVIGPVLADLFGRRLEVLPTMGWIPGDPSTWILPSITLGLVTAAYISRLTRAGMLDVLNQDFVRTARAKGVGNFRLLAVHCLRGGLIPVVAYLGPAFAAIISGSVVVESVFAVPGLGIHFIKSIEVKDRSVIIGCVLLYGTLILIANFVTDIIGIWLNPRLRASR